ncbi:hypothetical protein [Ktedonospora formicarum]|uniref:Uncharacterized protein n=1 Tax=Ktedonospora formicarum TaxID=2778364 RepID=A0A8J3HXS6_9CHLR|nr:hypothetical protein [Ktedonospora formicarum]GHO42908.1 hypothetical protein KSX_10710 [Ktedonospora formicarum]
MDNEYQRDQNLNQGQDTNLGNESSASQPSERKGLFERAKDFVLGKNEDETYQRDEDVTQNAPEADYESYGSGTRRDTISQRDDDIMAQRPTQGNVEREPYQQGSMQPDQDIPGGGVSQGPRQGDVLQEPLQQEPAQGDVSQRPLQGDIAQEPFQRDVTQQDQSTMPDMNQLDREAFDRSQNMSQGTMKDNSTPLDRDQGLNQEPLHSQQFDNQPEENFVTGSEEYDEAGSFDLFSERDEEMYERSWDRDDEVGEQYARSTDDTLVEEPYERRDIEVEDSTSEQDRLSGRSGERVQDKLKDLFKDSGDARSDR